MERWIASSFGPPIWVRRGGLWAKHMRLKQGAIGNTLRGTQCKHRNIMGTLWKPIGNLKGNMLGTKENPLSSTQNLKEKKTKAL
jgi:hypothetical protein